MEGATLSGRKCSAEINNAGASLAELTQRLPKIDIKPAETFEPALEESQPEFTIV